MPETSAQLARRIEVRSLTDPDLDALIDRLRRLDIENEAMRPWTPGELAIADLTAARLEVARAEKRRRLEMAKRGGPPVGRGTDRVKRIKERVDLLETVVRAIGPPDAIRGSAYWWRCPFHQERTAIFKVDPRRRQWYCHGACKRGGDVIDFVDMETGDFGRALDVLDPGERRPGPTRRLVDLT